MAQVTALYPWGVAGRFRTFSPKAAAFIFVSLDKRFLYTSANFGAGVNHYLEVHVRANTGTAFARLYDVTAAAVVSGSTVSTTSSSIARLRSSALTLVDGNEYVVQFGKAPADSADKLGADLISF